MCVCVNVPLSLRFPSAYIVDSWERERGLDKHSHLLSIQVSYKWQWQWWISNYDFECERMIWFIPIIIVFTIIIKEIRYLLQDIHIIIWIIIIISRRKKRRTKIISSLVKWGTECFSKTLNSSPFHHQYLQYYYYH